MTTFYRNYGERKREGKGGRETKKYGKKEKRHGHIDSVLKYEGKVFLF